LSKLSVITLQKSTDGKTHSLCKQKRITSRYSYRPIAEDLQLGLQLLWLNSTSPQVKWTDALR